MTLSGGVLIVSGNGAMADYGYGSSYNAPWRSNKASITSIVVEENVTSLGNYAFYELDKATTISLPSTLTSIGDNALQGCSIITTLSIPAVVFW